MAQATPVLPAPVGSIVAWLESMPGTPGLPENWVSCDGQVINTPGSPYDGQQAPDLNAPPGYFLRGGAESGILQPATTINTRSKTSRSTSART